MNAAPYLTQQGMATQQLQTVIVQNPAEEYPSFAVRKASSTGGIQLVLGILSIIFQISATAIEAEYGSTAAGIWAGFSFLVAGCIGLTVRSRKSCCKITFYGIFSFVAFLCSLGLLILAALGVGADRDSKEDICHWSYSEWDIYQESEDSDHLEEFRPYDECGRYNARIAMNIMLIIFAVIELVVASYAISICIRGFYGGRVPTQAPFPTVSHTGQTLYIYPGANLPRQYVAYPQVPPAQPIAIPAYDDVTAPPVYVYNEPGAAQASVPSILQDSYNNPTHQVYPPGNTPQPKPM